VFFAEPFDVEAVARDEMPEPLDGLCRTDQPTGAAPRHLARLAHREAAADRTVVGKQVRLRILRPAVEHDRDDLGDHVAGALDHDGVADADILARDLVLVVQGGTLHDHTPDGDRLEHRHRGQRALAANLDPDVVQHGLRLLCGKFLGDRPARRPADHAEPLLQGEIVDLVDHNRRCHRAVAHGRLRSRCRRRALGRRRGRGASAD